MSAEWESSIGELELIRRAYPNLVMRLQNGGHERSFRVDSGRGRPATA